MSARGSAVADIDGDGALDLVVVDIDGPVRVFRNALPAGRWIAIEPRAAPGDSRAVLETRVAVTAGGRTQVQVYRVSPSYASGSLVPLHFGLGSAEGAESVEIVWPGGERQKLGPLAGGKTYVVRRGAAPADMMPAVRNARP